MEEELARIDEAVCSLCGACVDSCPTAAIELSVERSSDVDVDAYEGVWVFAEVEGASFHPVVFELLGAGRRLADARETHLSALLFGEGVTDRTGELFMRGADRVYVADDSRLKAYLDEPYARILTRMVREYKPEIVLTGATALGRALIPRAATLLGTGLTADCTGLEIDPNFGHLLQTRPAFGGNIMARILCEHHRPQMATVRPRVMPEAAVDPGRTDGEVIRVAVDMADTASRTRVLETVRSVGESVKIAEADVIVAGGRGLDGPENFRMVHDLADAMRGTVAASRAAVDAGWIGYAHQVGQTGKTVAPRIYVAVGISGAIQHVVGMSSAEKIIAIDKNPNAPIFQTADYGLVGDLFEIVPALTKRFRKLREN